MGGASKSEWTEEREGSLRGRERRRDVGDLVWEREWEWE